MVCYLLAGPGVMKWGQCGAGIGGYVKLYSNVCHVTKYRLTIKKSGVGLGSGVGNNAHLDRFDTLLRSYSMTGVTR